MRQRQRNACPHLSPGLCAHLGRWGRGPHCSCPRSTGPGNVCRLAVGWWTHQRACLLSVHPPWAVRPETLLCPLRLVSSGAGGRLLWAAWACAPLLGSCGSQQLGASAAMTPGHSVRLPLRVPRPALDLLCVRRGAIPAPCPTPSFTSCVCTVSSPSRCFQEYRSVFR